MDADLLTSIWMKNDRFKKLLTLAASGAIFACMGRPVLAADCTQMWEHPISQQIEMRGMSMSLDEYANNERHFSIKQGNHVLDIYFLQDALLIKGPTSAEIAQYTEDELSWFPMAFAIPDGVLSSMSPNGPCAVKAKTRFSQRLSGKLGFGAHKLTFAEGSVGPAGPGTLAYTFAATINPPLEGLNSIQYSGSMRFARNIKPLAASTNVLGYTLVGVVHPLPVVGDATLRLSTLGELRALLARLEPLDQDDEESGAVLR
jgi:hypothetical protein